MENYPTATMTLPVLHDFVRFVDLDPSQRLLYTRFVESGASKTKLVQYCSGVGASNAPLQLVTLEEALVMGIRYYDKKMDAGTLPFILLRGIGDAFVDKQVALANVATFLDEQL